MKRIIDITASISWAFVVVVLIFVGFNIATKKEDLKADMVYCEVVDKDKETVIIPTGKACVPVTKYKLTILIGSEENETTINVGKEAYNNIYIGDSILCDIFYDSEGIVNITIADSNIVTD